jgi:uncharacterized phage protein (TIGR01671 family)
MGIRTIMFRGKRKDNGEWVEGYYSKGFRDDIDAELSDFIYMFSGESGKWEFEYAEVIPETVGQFSGLTDNGKKIFEGDIVRLFGENGEEPIVEIVWDEQRATFVLKTNDGTDFHIETSDFFAILGNIHDTPELLKGAYNA